MIEEITEIKYKTEDGILFDIMGEAVEHEMTNTLQEFIEANLDYACIDDEDVSVVANFLVENKGKIISILGGKKCHRR